MKRRLALGMLPALVAGCGLSSPGGSNVTVVVTRDYGAEPVASSTRHVSGSETVAGLLRSAGLSGTGAYYVNGIAVRASTTIHAGDRLWLDQHGAGGAGAAPAVVGSFPEPFVHGAGGKRLPTTLECAADVSLACQRVTSELTAIGVPIASGQLGTGSGTDSLGVVVGTWRDLRGELVAGLLAHGPSASGVYARFTGGSLELLDAHGRVTRTLNGHAGLIAATSQASAQPTWLVTGTDPAGVAAAAADLAPGPLHDHFAVAISGESELPVPFGG